MTGALRKITKNIGSRAACFSVAVVLASMGAAKADTGESVADAADSVHRALDLRIGLDLMQGLYMLEYQHGHFGFSVGAPETYAFTYYNNPGFSSFFYRAGYANWTGQDITPCINCGDEHENEMGRAAGLGVGYRIKKATGFNFNFSVGMSYIEDPDRRPEKEFGPWGGFSAGYAFSL